MTEVPVFAADFISSPVQITFGPTQSQQLSHFDPRSKIRSGYHPQASRMMQGHVGAKSAGVMDNRLKDTVRDCFSGFEELSAAIATANEDQQRLGRTPIYSKKVQNNFQSFRRWIGEVGPNTKVMKAHQARIAESSSALAEIIPSLLKLRDSLREGKCPL